MLPQDQFPMLLTLQPCVQLFGVQHSAFSDILFQLFQAAADV